MNAPLRRPLIAIDWGTSSLRGARLGPGGQVLEGGIGVGLGPGEPPFGGSGFSGGGCAGSPIGGRGRSGGVVGVVGGFVIGRPGGLPPLPMSIGVTIGSRPLPGG